MKTAALLLCVTLGTSLLHAQRAAHGVTGCAASPSIQSMHTGSWTLQLTYQGDIWSVKAVDQNVGWMAGDDGLVLRTVDGGVNWRSVGDASLGVLVSIEAVDSSTAWVASVASEAGGDVSIFRTVDGGKLWQRVFRYVGGYAFLDCLKMTDAGVGYAVGDPVLGQWMVVKTTDSGASWVALSEAPYLIGDGSVSSTASRC